MVVAPIPLIDWKGVFRKRAKLARAGAAKVQPSAGRFAASHFVATFAPKEPANIALYHPVGDELDTWPLAEALIEAGHAVLLPVVVDRKSPLVFRLFEIDQPLVDGAYGIKHPDARAEARRPAIVVTPLLAVRPDGARLGMGGGYYDRTLHALRAGDAPITVVGYGYAAQRFDRFPVDAHDQFLDGFVSERGAEQFDRRR